jgi:uncharacterized protein YbbC (DUF1343 family)
MGSFLVKVIRFIKIFKMMKNIRILFITIYFLFLFISVLNAQKVKSGLEVLEAMDFTPMKGKRVGLITNPTGVDHQLRSNIDMLFQSSVCKLVALFGPEHGVRGDYAAGDYVSNYTDPVTGIPVYSIYGKTRKPTKEMLEGIDVLVYDIQDIGSRSYTYISTLGLAM